MPTGLRVWDAICNTTSLITREVLSVSPEGGCAEMVGIDSRGRCQHPGQTRMPGRICAATEPVRSGQHTGTCSGSWPTHRLRTADLEELEFSVQPYAKSLRGPSNCNLSDVLKKRTTSAFSPGLVLGKELRALCLLGKHSTIELCS